MMVATYLTLCFGGFGIVSLLGVLIVVWDVYFKTGGKENG